MGIVRWKFLIFNCIILRFPQLDEIANKVQSFRFLHLTRKQLPCERTSEWVLEDFWCSLCTKFAVLTNFRSTSEWSEHQTKF